MVKLYFLGGEDIRKRESEKINKKMFSDVDGTSIVLIFPWTTKIEKLEYRKIMETYFRDSGATKVKFAELSDPLEKLAKKINNSDIIYLPGGDPKLLVKRIRDSKVDSLLNKYNKIIIGNSAGAMTLCKSYAVVKGQERHPKTGFCRGIGSVDFAVKVHYKSTNKSLAGQEENKELRELSKKRSTKIYAIPERSALVWNNGNIKFLGNIYLFYKGKKTKCKS